MIRSLMFAIVACLGACSSRAPAPTSVAAPDPSGNQGTAASGPAGSGSAGSGSAATDRCGDHPACTPPAVCLSYSGMAGPSGPTFHSCEIPCKDDSGCPQGKRCAMIFDGPGHVCR